uniref:N-acetylglucosamine-1-phosphotransferase subunit gamma-like n=1 Tax=Phallusia mammillata TaxID=59560 RepID=A0A6F9DD63_9ASCI|nr:N-acetylglucosamine-1-phosphotransferase subunit gamma-like [Phallusia mammillata]
MFRAPLMLWKLSPYFLIICYVNCKSNFVQMKIVDEVSNYGWNAMSGPDSSTSNLKAKVEPGAFCGPKHLKVLQGKCFTLLQEDYKYKFCPFFNVTQHERSMRWNPYSGILGIWKDWHVVNDSLSSMNFENGDDCGDDSRQVKVFLKCGMANNVTNVEEPRRCRYQLTFDTPLVCHSDSMLIYPIINSTLQFQWNQIAQDLHDNYITQKGYKKLTHMLFAKAGLVTGKLLNADKEKRPETFQTLDTCNAEYAKLYETLNSKSVQ